MIKHLSLTNFQKHRAFEHSFESGLTVCFGPNWAGKSTLQRAILYALFGTSAVPVKAANLVTQGAKEMVVVLAFEADGVTYQVSRGTRGAVLSKGGEAVASGHTGVTASIEALIGSAKDFLHFQTVRQGDATSLLTLGSAKLGEHLDRVTGADLVDRVLSKLRLEVKQLDGAPEALAQAQAKIQALQEEKAELTAKLMEALDGYQLREAEERALRQELSEAEHEISALYAVYERYQAFKTQRARIDSALRALGAPQAVSPQRLKQIHDEIESLVARQTRETMTQRERIRLQEQLSQAESVLAQPRPVFDPAALTEAKSLLDELVLSLRDADRQLQEAEHTLSTGTCKACQRPFDGLDRPGLEEKIHAARTAKRDLQARRSDVEHQISLCVAAQEAAERYDQWMAYHDQLEEQYRKLTPAQEIDAQQLVSLREEAAQVGEAMRQESRRRELEAELAELREPETIDEERLAQVRQRRTELWEKTQELAPQLTTMRQFLGNLEGQLQQLERALTEAKQAELGVRPAVLRLERLQALAKYLRTNRDRFSQRAWEQILGFASSFVQEATGGDVTALLREGDEFFYVEGGEQRPVELASGLQAAILGVAIKLALAAAVGSRFEVMLFDEVSAGAQDENSLRLTECLSRVAGQVFLISHREMDASVAKSVLSL